MIIVLLGEYLYKWYSLSVLFTFYATMADYRIIYVFNLIWFFVL